MTTRCGRRLQIQIHFLISSCINDASLVRWCNICDACKTFPIDWWQRGHPLKRIYVLIILLKELIVLIAQRADNIVIRNQSNIFQLMLSAIDLLLRQAPYCGAEAPAEPKFSNRLLPTLQGVSYLIASNHCKTTTKSCHLLIYGIMRHGISSRLVELPIAGP